MPDAKSWRKRRWDLFLREYYSSSDFYRRAEIYSEREDLQDGFTGFLNLMIEYKLPMAVLDAGWAFIKNPAMPDKEIYKLIDPPISFWNLKLLSSNGQTEDSTNKSENITRMLKPIREKYSIPDEDSLNFTLSVVKAIVGESTVIQVGANTGKSELKELVMEYGDAINQLTSGGDTQSGWFYPDSLKGKVYSETVQEMIVNSMIVDLKDKGWTYKQIQDEIRTLAIEPPDLDIMKQLVYNRRKKKGKTFTL